MAGGTQETAQRFRKVVPSEQEKAAWFTKDGSGTPQSRAMQLTARSQCPEEHVSRISLCKQKIFLCQGHIKRLIKRLSCWLFVQTLKTGKNDFASLPPYASLSGCAVSGCPGMVPMAALSMREGQVETPLQAGSGLPSRAPAHGLATPPHPALCPGTLASADFVPLTCAWAQHPGQPGHCRGSKERGRALIVSAPSLGARLSVVPSRGALPWRPFHSALCSPPTGSLLSGCSPHSIFLVQS